MVTMLKSRKVELEQKLMELLENFHTPKYLPIGSNFSDYHRNNKEEMIKMRGWGLGSEDAIFESKPVVTGLEFYNFPNKEYERPLMEIEIPVDVFNNLNYKNGDIIGDLIIFVGPLKEKILEVYVGRKNKKEISKKEIAEIDEKVRKSIL